jgi:hypothetical protein
MTQNSKPDKLMSDALLDICKSSEELMQYVDANKTDNPGQVRHAMKRLRQVIAEVRDHYNKDIVPEAYTKAREEILDGWPDLPTKTSES